MNLFKSLMAPLGKEHCMIYYVFGLLSLFIAVITLVKSLMYLTNKKTNDLGMILLINSLGLFLSYYLYRILYSICSRSLI